MKKLLMISMLLFATIGFFACSDDDDNQIPAVEVRITTLPPASLSNLQIKSLTANFVNRNTGITHKKENITTFTFSEMINEGHYDVRIEGVVTYTSEGNTIEAKIAGFKEGVEFTGANYMTTIDLFLSGLTNGNFIIEEIYAAGTLKEDGKGYIGDSYFKITNNSSETLYADGLCITETRFVTTTKYDYTPDIMATDISVWAVYMVPGNGTNYPVAPGESIIIADQAQNHLTVTANSIDLSNADFEWYDDTAADTDNPNVTNLDKIYSSSKTLWLPTQQGNRAYALVRLGKTKEAFLTENYYEYAYINNGKDMTGNAYRIPNEWVIDAVNVGIKDKFEWLVTAPSLDMGWTYWQETSSDKTGKGTSCHRKVLTTNAQGLNIYKDTNNSTEDFDVRVTPSLK